MPLNCKGWPAGSISPYNITKSVPNHMSAFNPATAWPPPNGGGDPRNSPPGLFPAGTMFFIVPQPLSQCISHSDSLESFPPLHRLLERWLCRVLHQPSAPLFLPNSLLPPPPPASFIILLLLLCIKYFGTTDTFFFDVFLHVWTISFPFWVFPGFVRPSPSLERILLYILSRIEFSDPLHVRLRSGFLPGNIGFSGLFPRISPSNRAAHFLVYVHQLHFRNVTPPIHLFSDLRYMDRARSVFPSLLHSLLIFFQP